MPTAAAALAALLIDTSGSMAAASGARRLIEMAADLMPLVLADAPGTRIVAFSSLPIGLTGLGPNTRNLRLTEADLHNLRLPYPAKLGLTLPEPGGSTALHLALNYVGRLRPKLTRIAVISDGEPDSVEAALASARALAPAEISAFYVGGDDNPAALKFMADLAQARGAASGTAGARSLTNPEALADEIAGLLLAGPAR